MMHINRYILSITIILLVVFLSSCVRATEKETSEPASVSVTEASIGEYRQSVSCFGSISYKNKWDVSSEAEGILNFSMLKEGQKIIKGQVLCTIDNPYIVAQYEQAQFALETARSSLANAESRLYSRMLEVESRFCSLEQYRLQTDKLRMQIESIARELAIKESLHKVGGITDEELISSRESLLSSQMDLEILISEQTIAEIGYRSSDITANGLTPSCDPDEFMRQCIELNSRAERSNVEAAQAEIRIAMGKKESARLMKDTLIVRSPASGVVAAVFHESGEYIQQYDKIVTVLDTSGIYAVFPVSETDVLFLNTNTTINLEIPSVSLSLESTGTLVSPIADPGSGIFSIKVPLDNKNGTCKPGMFARCTFTRGDVETLIHIPDTALLYEREGIGKVYCVLDSTAVLHEVYIRAREKGIVWIASGLEKGVQVIDSPPPYIREGSHVIAN